LLADRNANGIAPRELENAGPDEAIMHDDVGFLQLALRLERQKLGVARTCTHERDASQGRGGNIDESSLELAGIGAGITGHEGVANRSEEIALPEGTAAVAMRNALGDALAQMARCDGKGSQRLRQESFDLAAQAHAQ